MTLVKRVMLTCWVILVGLLGFATGYWVGMIFGHVKPHEWIQIGGIQFGNPGGILLGFILCVACMIWRYKTGRKKLLLQSETQIDGDDSVDQELELTAQNAHVFEQLSSIVSFR